MAQGSNQEIETKELVEKQNQLVEQTKSSLTGNPAVAILEYKQKAQALADEASKMVVKSDEQAAEATTYGSKLLELKKKLEEQKEALNGAAKKWAKFIDGLFNPSITLLDNSAKLIRENVGNFFTEKKRKADEAAKKEQERLDKLHEKKVAKAEAKGVEAPPPPPKVVAPVVSRSIGTSRVDMRWTFELAVEGDISKVPLKYLMLNRTEIQRAVDGGIREISGLIIKQVPKVNLGK